MPLTAVDLAGLYAQGNHPAHIDMSNAAEPRIGVIGVGGWGTTQADRTVDLGGQIIAGADPNPDAREAFEEQFDARTVDDFEKLPYDDLDGVIIGTPNKFHAPAAVHALERNVAVHVAKPMADAVASAEDMLEAADSSDAWGMVGFTSRFTPGVELFRAYHGDGAFGEISHVEIQTIRRRGIPGKGSWFCNAELAGGGALYDIGVHSIDRAMYMLDFPEPTEITGVARIQLGDRLDYADPDGWNRNWELTDEPFTVDDSTSGFVRFASGMTMSLEVAWATNRPPSRTTRIRGTDGGAVLGGEGDLEINTTAQHGTDHYVDTTLRGELEHTGQAGAAAVFLDGLRASDPPGTCTFEEGLLTQRLMDGLYVSSDRGQAVPFDDI